nr:CHAT domain-containing protein [Prochloraceae cyanobacterium]
MKKSKIVVFMLCLLAFLTAKNARASLEKESELETKILTEISVEKAKELYQNGEYSAAIALLNQIITAEEKNGNFLKKVLAERNLALIYLEQGQFQAAEKAIASANLDLDKITNIKARETALAGLLAINGQLQFERGQFKIALDNWQQAADLYQKNQDEQNYLKNQISTVRALQNLGLYGRSLKIARKIEQNLENKPNDFFKHQTLLTLGSLLQGKGRLAESEKVLQTSLNIAQELNSNEAIAKSLLSLANTARLQGKLIEALNLYQQTLTTSQNPRLEIEVKLNQLNLLIATGQIESARSLISQIEANLNQLPANHDTVYARINLAQNSLQLIPTNQSEIILNLAIAAAETLGDRRGLSYGWGTLGRLYELNDNLEKARQLTEKALFIAQGINAPEIAYQWEWQLGRIYKQQQNRKQAILAYSHAKDNLDFLRRDLIANSSQIRFNFRETVEPLYRELADLLLQPEATQADLQLARETIEALQLAELDNFFKDACLDAQPVRIDAIDRNAAIFYTIILEDRLEIILALPDRPLTRYATPVSQLQVETTIEGFRVTLNDPFDDNYQTLSEIIYSWAIAPLESQLAANQVQNLVFVMDGVLRNIPMAALFDGEQYLIEKYAIAYAPTLQLIDERTANRTGERVLLAGLSEARQDFPALPGVKEELDTIQAKLASQILLNERFTQTNFATALDRNPFSIVHIASHGEFSSRLEDTFILTWNDRINISELNSILRSDFKQTDPIELLVLSACQTAVGDSQAAIGLAGMAVRAGARS